MAPRCKRAWWALFLAGLVILVAFDRGYWAEVAQWREDQACNLWLGYSRNPLTLPLGLISSVGTPNPNGMPLLAVALSQLPNLWAISTALGLLQGVLVVWVCWLIAGPRPLFLLLALPALSSVVLRATSVDFWNQWILTSVNLAFFGLWIAFLRRQSPWAIVGCIALMLYAPAMYLAGLVNAVLYLVFVLAALWMRPPELSSKDHAAPALVALALVGLAIVLTWAPFAKVMDGMPLPGSSMTVEIAQHRLLQSLESALGFPRWSVTHWYHHTELSFLQSSHAIMGSSAKRMLRWSTLLLLVQASLALLALLVALAGRLRTQRPFAKFFATRDQFIGRSIMAGLVLVMLAVVLSPLLGGPAWTTDDRPDQQVQFLPFLLFAWFALPYVVKLPTKIGWALRGSTLLVALCFCVLSLRGGWQIVLSHLNYRGSSLTDADVPLQHRRQAVAFIAHDWLTISADRKIPVSYQLGQEWVDEFGKQLDPWYPAPMTVGRAFDFELSRVYGLTNTQEGLHTRSSRSVRYLVSYAFARLPYMPGASVTHHDFGRIRVTIAAH
jgi:hypothetical protein